MRILAVLLFFRNLFAQEEIKWAVYYDNLESVEAFFRYEWIVFDRFEHPPVKPLIDRKKIVFGYVTLGEIEEHVPWYQAAKEGGLLVEENKNWPGSWMVDLRNPLWERQVIEEVIPFILAKGFNGLFFDTLDNASYLEEKDPEKYKGMREAAARLVKTIRLHFPKVKIMMNRGFEIAVDVASHIDFLLGEALFTNYNFEEGTYSWKTEDDQDWGIQGMLAAKEKNPHLHLLSLDYWDPKDKTTIQKIYKKARMDGFIPYVATIDLKALIPEPTSIDPAM